MSFSNTNTFMSQRASGSRIFDLGIVTVIPIEFGADLPFFLPIKIQPHPSMKNSMLTSDQPLVPALFDKAARQEKSEPETAAIGSRISPGELMLDARRLEEVLNAAVRRKKATGRKVSTSRFERRISINGSQIA